MALTRGSQSDPSHTHAPVCPCLRACNARMAWARRVGARVGASTTRPSRLSRAGWACPCTNSVRRVHQFGAAGLAIAGLKIRALAGLAGCLATWVAPGHFAGLLGLFPGLGGPLARAWLAWAGVSGLAMPVFTVYNHSAGRAYSTGAYGLAYGLTYGLARAWPALSVRLSTGPSVFTGYRSKP